MAITTIVPIKNKFFLESLHAYLEKEHSEENYDFLYDKSNNQVLYQKYIKTGSPKEVNISSALRNPLDALATQKKWSSMAKGMQDARNEIFKLINSDSLPRFLVTSQGKLSTFMVTVSADGTKANTLVGLIGVYAKPRTPADKQAAYDGMLKLVSMSVLNPALHTLGYEPPAKVVAKKGDPTKALKVMGVPSKIAPQMAKLIDIYNKAGSQKAKDVALDQMETLAKGIVKRDQIIAGLKSSGLM